MSDQGFHAEYRFEKALLPAYKSYSKRLDSFISWPKIWIPQVNPEQLAIAGFYYTGKRDKVRCFHCGGEICNWKPTDKPWQRHAERYPHCRYLLTRDISSSTSTSQ